MLELVRDLEQRLAGLEKTLRGVRSARVDRSDIRATTRDAIDFYFRVVREALANSGVSDEVLDSCDRIAHDLLEATHRRVATATYRTLLKSFHRGALDAEKVVLLASKRSQVEHVLDPTDKRIVDTLNGLLPSAALSYEQAILDLSQSTRLSWRGPATDLRESLRETLDHLAPDKDVSSQPGFKLESGTSGPTMKQKVRFILRKRGVSKAAMDTPEAAVAAVDDAVGTFVRSVYTRSSVSTHTPTDRSEVLRIRDWVRVALCELLAIS
jgi:hypothetical protein